MFMLNTVKTDATYYDMSRCKKISSIHVPSTRRKNIADVVRWCTIVDTWQYKNRTHRMSMTGYTRLALALSACDEI